MDDRLEMPDREVMLPDVMHEPVMGGLTDFLHPDPFHPTFTIIPILMFGLWANIFYLLGPALELAIGKRSRGRILLTGPTLFRMGLTFRWG